MPLKTAFVEKAFVAKQFCLAGDKRSLLQSKGTVRKAIGCTFKENAAGACWSDVLPAFTDTKGQKMGSEICPLSSQTSVLWDHEPYSHPLPPLSSVS